jgi:DNA-binding transcriptional ArsR family regulator
MVEYQTSPLDRVFHAVSDPTRRAMLDALRRKPMTVTEAARPFPMSLNAVSKHVMVLERAGLVRREVVGRTHRLTLNPQPLRRASAWLGHYEKFWLTRLDALEQHFAGMKKQGV